MQRLALFLSLALLLPASPGFAVERGLNEVVVTPASPPGDPEAVVAFLTGWPGFESASWDTSDSTFRATVRDSATYSNAEFLNGLVATGLQPETVLYRFQEVRCDQSTAQLLSPCNGMTFWVRHSLWAARMWEFLGKNPYGRQVPLHVELRVLPASADAPDTAIVQGFTLATESEYVQSRIKAMKEEARSKTDN